MRLQDAAVKSGRKAEDVRLVAVSKKQPLERIEWAVQAGQRVFGENYLQSLEERRARFPDLEWHLVGSLQSNKAKRAAKIVAMVHALDSEKTARLLSEHAEGRRIPVLIEVNTGGEASKAGIREEAVPAFLESVRGLPGIAVAGLMCIPPPGEGRRHFAGLRALRDRLEGSSGLRLAELSMGMSNDFEEAILEGATLVRVGTRIFGQRG
jgi:pyridoxal phosphate enzyme (YggS family)